MRVAIATGVYHHPQETQINFHVRNLFGGDTVIVAQDARNPDPYGRPVHIWGQADDGLLRRAVQQARSFVSHRTLKVPQGASRARLQSFLREEKVGAVLAEFGTAALRVAPVAVEIGLPVFTYFRGADASAHLREPFRAEAYRRLMPNLRGVFAVSQFLLDNLARHGIRHPDSHVIPSGVDTDLFRPGRKRPGQFIAIGRFIEKKRPDITVRAFAAAARVRPDVTLEMIGEGPLLEASRTLAQSQGVGDRIRFTGRLPHEVVRERLAESAVFLQHSVTARDGDTEGLPTSIQEAMAAGLVIVSTRHAGIPEAVVEGDTGFLVEEGDEAGFSRAILRVADLGAGIEDMSARARALAVARYDNRRLVRKLEGLITTLSARGGTATAADRLEAS